LSLPRASGEQSYYYYNYYYYYYYDYYHQHHHQPLPTPIILGILVLRKW